MADLIFRHLAGADGEGVYKNGKTGFSVSYFKKKEIDSRYPSGGYMVVGQIGKGKREIGNLQSDDGQTEKVYAATKMPHTAVVGYIETEADKFIAIVKDRLLLWLLFALLIAALIIGLIFLLKAVIPTGGDGGTTTPPAGVIDQNAVLGEGEISIPDKTKTRGRQIKVYGIPESSLGGKYQGAKLCILKSRGKPVLLCYRNRAFRYRRGYIYLKSLAAGLFNIKVHAEP